MNRSHIWTALLAFSSTLMGMPAEPSIAQLSVPKSSARVEKNVFVADAPYRLKMTLDPKFQYLGRFPFDIKGIAGGYRYVWGETDNGKHLCTTFIVQAEGYYPDNQGSYKYGTPNPETFAGDVYQHNVWIYDNDQSAQGNPGNESDLTRKFMREKGYEWESQLVMSRFARIVDEPRKNEIIFFYFENLKHYTTKRVSDFPDEGESAEQKVILAAVDANSRAAFTVAHFVSRAFPVAPASAAHWREDLHYFAERAPQVHKNLFHSMTRKQFQTAVKSLDERIPTLSRDQIIIEITRIVAMIGDGHTHVDLHEPPTNFRHYPVKFYWFPDGVYVLQADKKYAQAVGGRIVKLGKASGRDVYEAASKIVPRDNESQLKWMTPFYMSLAEVLDGLDLVDNLDAVPLIVEKDGVQTTVILKPEAGELSPAGFVLPADWVDARDSTSPQPLWQQDSANNYWFDYLKDSRTIYVQFNAVAQKSDETIEVFFKRVMQFADAHPVDRFVLDERLNDGGNNHLLRPIIHAFIRSDTVNQPGKLFTIIGRQTFSAAMNCVNRMKLNTHTIFVGEPTASSPNHYGDNSPVVLPNSKLTVRLSTLWWQDMDPRDKRIWQAPDLSTELTFADYRAGRDPAMNAILHYDPTDIIETIGTEAEKNDYAGAKAALQKFLKDPLHKYATVEANINDLGYQFINAEKFDQAIFVLKLNAEANPDSFNAWDSLGEAYALHGDRKSAIQSYEKSILLNPQNEGGIEALGKLRH